MNNIKQATNNVQKMTIDVYTSIPIKYNDKNKLTKAHKEEPMNSALNILEMLNLRGKMEFGSSPMALSDYGRLDICRYSIGKVELKLLEETAVAELLISIDAKTQCGVLHLILLPLNLNVTDYLDKVSINDLEILNKGKTENLLYYLKETYNIEKTGTSKNFLTICKNRNDISDDLLSSILFCEQYFEENSSLSIVVDEDIKNILSKGNAQYKYANVYAYKNAIVQILNSHYWDNKIEMECITLFYIELILFEEATIEKASSEIISLLANTNNYRPKEILQIVDEILTEHVKSIGFENLRMNYSSSQKSMNYIRDAFEVEEKKAIFQKNQKELLMIYDIRSDIVDKEETKFISIIATIFTIVATTFTTISFIEAPLSNTKLILTTLCILSVLFVLVYRRYMQRKIWHKKFCKKNKLEKQ